jgi:hypothetical protein
VLDELQEEETDVRDPSKREYIHKIRRSFSETMDQQNGKHSSPAALPSHEHSTEQIIIFTCFASRARLFSEGGPEVPRRVSAGVQSPRGGQALPGVLPPPRHHQQGKLAAIARMTGDPTSVS